MEAYFLSSGFLLPTFHKSYWLGVRARPWGRWQALDKTLTANYLNWAVGQPNGSSVPELCVAANASATGQLSGSSSPAWGYADASCMRSYPFMCRIPGRRPQKEPLSVKFARVMGQHQDC